MSAPAGLTAADCVVLLVSDADDELVREARAAIERTPARVESVVDVYQALARLAHDDADAVRMMLVDPRTADQVESRVYQVVRRYFPGVVIAPLAAHATPLLADADRPNGLTPEAAAARVRQLVPQPAPAIPSAAPPAPQPPAAPPPARDDEAALSLHDAVRQRMTAGAEVARRVPPRKPPVVLNPPRQADASPPPPDEPALLTPAELDALLQPENGDPPEEGAS